MRTEAPRIHTPPALEIAVTSAAYAAQGPGFTPVSPFIEPAAIIILGEI